MATTQHNSEQPSGLAPGTERGSCGSASSKKDTDALASLGAELLHRAKESQPGLEKAWVNLLASWGVQGEPVGVERLRALIQEECGSKADDNAFSRELIELREERRS